MNVETIALRVFAVLIGLRALTNVFKPLGAGSGLVFFGKLLTGIANIILAPLVGIAMLIYVYGLWTMRRFALPMGVLYGMFVVINMALFPVLQPLPEGVTAAKYAVFVVVGLGVCWGAVWLLLRRRGELA